MGDDITMAGALKEKEHIAGQEDKKAGDWQGLFF
jgi:hypothetical protein